MINWRSLLSELRVDWSDRGPNRSTGQITIKCPQCGAADPSRHLAINEATGQYYCFRNPQGHSGKSAPYLLRALGVSPSLVVALLNQYGDGKTAQPSKNYVSTDAGWDRYLPAANNPQILSYLEERGIVRPAEAARIFDLRYAPNGQYAQRVLMPIHQANGKIGFTGRALVPRITPKYLMHESVRSGVYLPHVPEELDTLVIVEGPFDALKMAWALEDQPIVPAALLGLALPETRLKMLVDLAKRAKHVLVALDSDQPVSVVYRIIREIAVYLTCEVVRCPIPSGSKDPGELSMQGVREWLKPYAHP